MFSKFDERIDLNNQWKLPRSLGPLRDPRPQSDGRKDQRKAPVSEVRVEVNKVHLTAFDPNASFDLDLSR